MIALANSVCLLALSSDMHEREHSAKHGTARHSTAPHAGNDTTRHRTTLSRAVDLAKLNGAGACVFVLSAIYTQLGVTRNKNLTPHLLKAIRCAHVLP